MNYHYNIIELKYVFFLDNLHKKIITANGFTRFFELLNVGSASKIIFLIWFRGKICSILNLWWIL